MPSGPSEKGEYLSPPPAFLLAKTYDSSPSSLQPLEPFLPGCSSAKCKFETWFETLSLLCKTFSPHKYHILFQKQQQSIKAE